MNLVLKASESIRLDHFLSQHLSHSRSQIKKMIQAKAVRVNGFVEAKAGFMLSENDEIVYTDLATLEPGSDSVEKSEVPNLEIVYQDEYFAVLNKPAGMQMYQEQSNAEFTFVDAYDALSLPRAGGEDPLRQGIVHRLDRYTEGLLLVAKTSESFVALQDLFRLRQIQKKYYALVRGPIFIDAFSIDKAIGRQKKGNKMTCQNPKNPKEALTHVEVLKRYGDTKVLLVLKPETGRTHQLRVHMQYYGQPILGEPVYYKPFPAGKAQLLQAFFLAFKHPFTQQNLQFELPLSKRLMLK